MYSIVDVNVTPFYFSPQVKIKPHKPSWKYAFFLDNDAVVNNSRRVRDTAEGREVQEKVQH
jgi:hypothetical protein